MNQNVNVTYNPDVGQPNQSVLAYTTSGINQTFLANDILYGLNSQERADAEVILDMLARDIEKCVKERMQGNPNVRY